MKIAINAFLLLLICILGFGLYSSIKEPIAFGDAKDQRSQVVVDKLENIRTVQEVYRLVTGEFANDFDTLVQVIKNDSIKVVKILGDKDDITNTDKFEEIVSYRSALDSLVNLGVEASFLDNISSVPYSDGKTFDIESDTLTYQSTLVSVVEVGTRWKNFMGEYASPKYKKYDNRYDPNKKMKFGDMNKPSLSGNWE